ncbi:VCBS domain-containing protein [Alsobacter metallidurans]|nr:VCBS domain-containing protein [Alsobacter metallidurans]
MSSLPAVTGNVGATTAPNAMKSFKALDAADGVYYAKGINTLAITKNGAVFDGVNFSGVQLNVQADNVVFKNCYFDARVGAYGINAFPGSDNLTVDHCTFDGLKLNRAYTDFVSSRGLNTTITNCAFLNAPEDGLSIVSGKIAGNYIAGGAYHSTAHSDAIYIAKTLGPIVIQDNIIDWRTSGANNALRVTGEGGDVSNVTVTRNIMLGGGYTVLVTDGATLTHTAAQIGSVTKVKVYDNVVDFGSFGNLYSQDRPADLVYAGNHYASGPLQHAGASSAAADPASSLLNNLWATTAGQTLNGTGIADRILGGGGSNLIQAGAGDDVVQGGADRDYISLGAGRDRVKISSWNDGRDFVSDFVHGQDRLDLAALAGTGVKVSDWTWVGSKGFTGAAWQLRASTTNGTTVVQLDRNGDLTADFSIDLKGAVALSLSDFILSHNTAVSASPAPTPPVIPAPPTKPAPTADDAHAPTVAAGVVATALAETAANSGKTSYAHKTGVFNFSDLDIGDAHHVSVTNAGPSYVGGLNASVQTQASGSKAGAVQWTYAATERALDTLSAGEVVKQTFNVKIADDDGKWTSKAVVVSLAGSEDAPNIRGAMTANAYEGQSTTIRKQGALAFNDVDRKDTLTTSLIDKSVHFTGAAGQDLTNHLTKAQIAQFENAIQFKGAAHGNEGSGQWSLNLADSAVRFLDLRETLTIHMTVGVHDQHGGHAEAEVVATIRGVNDDHPTLHAANFSADLLLI